VTSVCDRADDAVCLAEPGRVTGWPSAPPRRTAPSRSWASLW